MKKYMILFVVGKDRPGIVDDVSTMLFERGANIEDSRMATLGGCFSIMVLISCPEEKAVEVRRGLEVLSGLGFDAYLHEAADPVSVPRQVEIPMSLEIRAMDHPGIVQKVVRLLRRRNVNIESLDTHVTSAPWSGAPLFNLRLSAGVPAGQSIMKIKEELTALAAEMNLDLSFGR
ncbi:MAG: ACT domain-containing protein [Thermodesulfobacteriota bacterium]